MAIMVSYRWAISDPAVGMTEARRARDKWLQSGATEFRLHQIHAGPHTGQWLFHLTFADFAAYGKALDLVRGSEELKTWQRENAKAHNVLQQTDISLGIDL